MATPGSAVFRAAALEDAKLKGGEKANDIAPPTIADDVAKGYTGGAVDLLSNVEKVTVDTPKVTEYALNPNNTSGGANKAQVFESALGYNQSNSNDFMQQIQSNLPTGKAILGTADKNG